MDQETVFAPYLKPKTVQKRIRKLMKNELVKEIWGNLPTKEIRFRAHFFYAGPLFALREALIFSSSLIWISVMLPTSRSIHLSLPSKVFRFYMSIILFLINISVRKLNSFSFIVIPYFERLVWKVEKNVWIKIFMPLYFQSSRTWILSLQAHLWQVVLQWYASTSRVNKHK